MLGMKFARRHRHLAGIVLPVLFLCGLVCPCAQRVAQAQSVHDRDTPACCHQKGDKAAEHHSHPSSGEHRPDCQHCGQLQVLKTDRLPLISPPASSVVAVPPAFLLDVSRPPAELRLASPRYSALSPPPSLLRLKCVLLI